MTTIRRHRDNRECRRLSFGLAISLLIAGCSAADPRATWPRGGGDGAPLSGSPWSASEVVPPVAGATTTPLRAGSMASLPPSGEAARREVTPSSTAAAAGAESGGSSAVPLTTDEMNAALSELGKLDLTPAEQQRLLETMKGTEPAEWAELVRRHGQSLASNPAQPAAATAQLASHVAPVDTAGPAEKPDAGPGDPAQAGGETTASLATSASSDPPTTTLPAELPTADRPSASSPPALAPQTPASPASPHVEMAAALMHLDQASQQLRCRAPLVCKNLAFCREVTSFGVYRPFEQREFSPGQEVLLYAEIENFVSQGGPDGFHTALDSRYEITDAAGKQIESRHFGTTEDVCRNERRDFFIRYQFALPPAMPAGNYTLRLTIQDTLGGKASQASIELLIK